MFSGAQLQAVEYSVKFHGLYPFAVPVEKKKSAFCVSEYFILLFQNIYTAQHMLELEK